METRLFALRQRRTIHLPGGAIMGVTEKASGSLTSTSRQPLAERCGGAPGGRPGGASCWMRSFVPWPARSTRAERAMAKAVQRIAIAQPTRLPAANHGLSSGSGGHRIASQLKMPVVRRKGSNQHEASRYYAYGVVAPHTGNITACPTKVEMR